MDSEISVQLQSQRWKTLLRPYCKTVRAACEAALAASHIAKLSRTWEMAVVLADDEFIQTLNNDYRGYDKPTNVLSFPSGLLPPPKGMKTVELGDIILALETVEREAKEQGKTFRAHATHLLVHGTLHLLGHDHMKKAEAQTMERLEIEILAKLCVSNPYL